MKKLLLIGFFRNLLIKIPKRTIFPSKWNFEKSLILLLSPLLCFGNPHPFNYDLHLSTIKGKGPRTMLCLHGYGANYQIANSIHRLALLDNTLISFNFPDHDLHTRNQNTHQISFGTVEELLPVFYVLKKIVVDEGLSSIDLYGFSAGGAAVVNLLVALNSSTFDVNLKALGIEKKEKQQILNAITKGIVILDVPLKSVEEIVSQTGHSHELEIIAQNYRKNDMRPIDSLQRLTGLNLNIILHFQEKDEVLSNRDDAIFASRLAQVNSLGTTSVIIGNEGGHNVAHLSLWKVYLQKIGADGKTDSDISP